MMPLLVESEDMARWGRFRRRGVGGRPFFKHASSIATSFCADSKGHAVDGKGGRVAVNHRSLDYRLPLEAAVASSVLLQNYIRQVGGKRQSAFDEAIVCCHDPLTGLLLIGQ